ncbi:Tda7p NDAI_0F03330 [Naumovozyma dairenensis CBS 421]|uniref:Uncharacterized protein n=1 Tax=Naumovozyma dairenensis (strain ATCC 10597 / BCRC 20456 / CBS 421 / NBRC 0211 / NRRL Y-12639) TaxID=1071378 RepID=G0WCZ0_NAUDC|nr:hypothetical protein NDAI_0F03330 [Naumovozyma dairenensis CBS 421]CCD25651.1 hypothetical protein NDAI_0F03330 [Naumovozyma dairenensis CBS 421]
MEVNFNNTIEDRSSSVVKSLKLTEGNSASAYSPNTYKQPQGTIATSISSTSIVEPSIVDLDTVLTSSSIETIKALAESTFVSSLGPLSNEHSFSPLSSLYAQTWESPVHKTSIAPISTSFATYTSNERASISEQTSSRERPSLSSKTLSFELDPYQNTKFSETQLHELSTEPDSISTHSISTLMSSFQFISSQTMQSFPPSAKSETFQDSNVISVTTEVQYDNAKESSSHRTIMVDSINTTSLLPSSNSFIKEELKLSTSASPIATRYNLLTSSRKKEMTRNTSVDSFVHTTSMTKIVDYSMYTPQLFGQKQGSSEYSYQNFSPSASKMPTLRSSIRTLPALKLNATTSITRGYIENLKPSSSSKSESSSFHSKISNVENSLIKSSTSTNEELLLTAILYSVYPSSNIYFYVYTQMYDFTDSSTTFITGLPTTVSLQGSPTTLLTIPTSTITKGTAFYKEWLNGNLDSQQLTSNSHDQTRTNKKGAIIGGVVSGICVASLCAAIIWVFIIRVRRRRSRKNGVLFQQDQNRRYSNYCGNIVQVDTNKKSRWLNSKKYNNSNTWTDTGSVKVNSSKRVQPPPVPPPRKTTINRIPSTFTLANSLLPSDIRLSYTSSTTGSSIDLSQLGSYSSMSTTPIRVVPELHDNTTGTHSSNKQGFLREII